MLLAFAALAPAALCQAAASGAAGAGVARIELPTGPAERALATLPEAEPAVFAEWPAWLAGAGAGAASGWEAGAAAAPGSDPWTRWAACVETARAAPGTQPAARARAELGLLAAAQGRSDQAWDHWLAAQADPGAARALALRLVGGVSADVSGPGGTGWSCAPMLPPPGDPSDVRARAGKRTARALALELGSARVDVAVTREADGVQIELRQTAGEPCRLAVTLPCPRHLAVGARYVDWLRAPDDGCAALEVALEPGAPARELWGRFVPAPEPWPGLAPDAVSAARREGGIELADEGDAAALGFAAACERLFAIPARTAGPGAVGADGAAGLGPASAGRAAPIRLDLGGPDAASRALRPRKLAALMGLAEHAALGP
jgi:hypothetical protein